MGNSLITPTIPSLVTIEASKQSETIRLSLGKDYLVRFTIECRSSSSRATMPYNAFSVVMRFGRWHRLIRPDGLTSIRRSFVPENWPRMCSGAGLDASTAEIREYRPGAVVRGACEVGPPLADLVQTNPPRSDECVDDGTEVIFRRLDARSAGAGTRQVWDSPDVFPV